MNFLRDHPAGIFREVEHGLFDSAVETEDREAQIGKQFVFWYRDHKFSGYCSQIHKGVTASPAHHYFVSGKNAVVYRETLSGIDALGAVLIPLLPSGLILWQTEPEHFMPVITMTGRIWQFTVRH